MIDMITSKPTQPILSYTISFMAARATTTISTVIVDDEQLASEELLYLLKDFPDVEVVATGANGLDAFELIEKLEPDLVFLDVQMPGMDGLTLIRKLREKEVPLPYFILATAYDQYAIEAFTLEAMDYLLKPIEKDRLAMTIDRARRAISERTRIPQPDLSSQPRSSGQSCW